MHNFWYKQLTLTHKQLAKCVTHLLANPEYTPKCMLSGIIYLLPKTKVHILKISAYSLNNRKSAEKSQEDAKNNLQLKTRKAPSPRLLPRLLIVFPTHSCLKLQEYNFLKYAMTQWQTNLILNTPKVTINAGVRDKYMKLTYTLPYYQHQPEAEQYKLIEQSLITYEIQGSP